MRRFLVRAGIRFCAVLPPALAARLARRLRGIQLSPGELRTIVATVKRKAPCRFLVFGLGNDSLLYAHLNRGGTTIFLEDDRAWFEARDRHLRAYWVEYGTRRTQWKELLEAPGKLEMALPDEIENGPWDVILVDAPAGWNDAAPGRMQSIFLSSRLAGPSCDVFVHDCDRPIEQVFCDRFLKEENRVAEIGRLRHYRLPARRA